MWTLLHSNSTSHGCFEGKGGGLDLHFVLLQLPKKWGTHLELPFRTTWRVKERPLLCFSPHKQGVSPESENIRLQSHRLLEGSGSLWVCTCGDMAAVETHECCQCAHFVWIFCCSLVSGGILPTFGEISVSSLSPCCLIP